MRRCEALGCQTLVPPRVFICARHLAMVPETMDAHDWFRSVERMLVEPGPPDAWMLKAYFVIRHLALLEKRNPSDHIIVRVVETKRRERLGEGEQASARAVAPETPVERVSL